MRVRHWMFFAKRVTATVPRAMPLSRPELDAALGTENVDRLDALVGIWALQLHPIRSTDDLLNFIYCVHVYPASTPHRAERIAADMPSG